MSLVWNRLPAGRAFAIAVLEAHDEAGHIVSLLLVEVPGIPVDLRDPKGRLLVVKVEDGHQSLEVSRVLQGSPSNVSLCVRTRF